MIRQQIVDEIVAHARDEAPNECCGLLVGRENVVDECIRTRNAKASPSEYLVDPADHFAAIRRVRAEGRSIVGAYHSHPRTAAVPSETDVSEAHYPEFVYLIVSLAIEASPQVRAYEVSNGSLAAIELVPVG